MNSCENMDLELITKIIKADDEYIKKYEKSITRSEYLLLVNYRDWILWHLREEW